MTTRTINKLKKITIILKRGDYIAFKNERPDVDMEQNFIHDAQIFRNIGHQQ